MALLAAEGQTVDYEAQMVSPPFVYLQVHTTSEILRNEPNKPTPSCSSPFCREEFQHHLILFSVYPQHPPGFVTFALSGSSSIVGPLLFFVEVCCDFDASNIFFVMSKNSSLTFLFNFADV